MAFEEISNRRLINQQITGTKFSTAMKIVGWMGAVQAQDYAMAKWAIGLRLARFTDGVAVSKAVKLFGNFLNLETEIINSG